MQITPKLLILTMIKRVFFSANRNWWHFKFINISNKKNIFKAINHIFDKIITENFSQREKDKTSPGVEHYRDMTMREPPNML